MTLLVPSDFSPLSRIAVFYAAELAKSLHANVIMVAVINPNPTSETLLHTKKLEEEMISAVSQDAEELMREIRDKVTNPPSIEFHTATGFPFDEVIDGLVKKFNADMIVMGSKGATGLKRVLLGSNAVAVINNSGVPVLVIPENAGFAPLKRIVYATDMNSYREETKTIAMFAGLFSAEVRILHVLRGEQAGNLDADMIVKELAGLTNYEKISFEVARGDNIAEVVDTFVTQSNADMLAMFTHHLDFYEKLFGRSVTRRLAFHSRVPLLTFNKTTLE